MSGIKLYLNNTANLHRHFQVTKKTRRKDTRAMWSYKRSEDYDQFTRDKQATGLVLSVVVQWWTVLVKVAMASAEKSAGFSGN